LREDVVEEFEKLREQFREIGGQHRDAMREAYRAHTFGWPLWRAVVEAGLLDFVLEEPALSLQKLAAALSGLTAGSGDGGFMIVPITHAALGMYVVRQDGHPELRERYLDRLRTGEEILSFAITEPAGGTDAFRPQTVLREQDGQLLLSGDKWHITSAPVAAMSIVWAADPAHNDIAGVLVEHDWPGVEASAPLRPAGTHSAPVGSLSFHDVEVPPTHVIGAGRGRAVLSAALMRERVLAGFAGAGIIELVLHQAMEFAVSRQVFGAPIATHQHVQRRLCDIKLRLDTVRALGDRAMAKVVAGERFALEASQLKMTAVRYTMEAVTDAMQVCGSYGVQEEAGLYPMLLDALCGTIAGGTEEAHRLVIMRELVRDVLASGPTGAPPAESAPLAGSVAASA
jgi:alkylation response protein AidB-like acyl-CoA dehydrogenase